MKIKISNKDILEIIQPNITHKAQTYTFFTISIIGSLAVILSREGLQNGIVLYLLFIFSIIMAKFGGKPEVATFDKLLNSVVLVEYKGSFSKPTITSYILKDIVSCEMDNSSFIGSEVSARGYTIKIELKSGEKVAILPFVNHRKKVEIIFQELKAFLLL